MGFDAAVQELVSPKTKAAGLLLAADVSPKTEKEIRFAAEIGRASCRERV